MEPLDQDTMPVDDAPVISVPPMPAPVIPPPVLETVLPYSPARPWWYVALLSVVTGGLYEYVWFYRGWKTILAHYHLSGSALVNAIFYPLGMWSFFHYAFRLNAEARGESPRLSAMTCANLYVVLFFVSFTGFKSQPALAIPVFVLTNLALLLSLIPLREGVRAMNAGYVLCCPQQRPRTTLSPGAITALVVGGFFWVIWVLSIAFPIPS